jgi:hypothetical protein
MRALFTFDCPKCGKQPEQVGKGRYWKYKCAHIPISVEGHSMRTRGEARAQWNAAVQALATEGATP